MLTDANIYNRAIFVIRYYGGEHLGHRVFRLTSMLPQSAIIHDPYNRVCKENQMPWPKEIANSNQQPQQQQQQPLSHPQSSQQQQQAVPQQQAQVYSQQQTTDFQLPPPQRQEYAMYTQPASVPTFSMNNAEHTSTSQKDSTRGAYLQAP